MQNYRPNWNEYFMLLAKLAATRSTCVSRKVGAVIVKNRHIIATGYNGSMPGVTHCADEGRCYWRTKEDGDKYKDCRACHAEANAIAQAAKYGISVDGASIYTTLAPCYSCFKLLVVAGIKEIYYEIKYNVDYESEEWKKIVKESGIRKVEKISLPPNLYTNLLPYLLGNTSEKLREGYLINTGHKSIK